MNKSDVITDHTNGSLPGFKSRLESSFSGVLRWPQLDELWTNVLSNGDEWYFYQVGSPLPVDTLHGQPLSQTIKELDNLIRQEHDYDYCGIVYVDNSKEPGLIKVYDPAGLGSSCGCGGNQILPRWFISKYPPEKIQDDVVVPNNRRRWWNSLFTGRKK